MKLRIRPMTAADIDFALQCTIAEGWISETRDLFEGFLEYAPEGCFLGEVDNRPIGMCVATPYGEYGFFGELIVIKEMRGRGFGLLLTANALDYLANSGAKQIYLDGDHGAIGLYERLRFRKICRSLRFRGAPPGVRHPSIRPATAGDLPLLEELDRAAFGEDRSFFLRRTWDKHRRLCFVYETNGRVEGFIFGRRGDTALTVGPWLATEAIPDPLALVHHMAAENEGSTLRIGVMESHESCAALLRSHRSFEETESSWRMVQGPSERLGNHKHLFSIGSPAKG